MPKIYGDEKAYIKSGKYLKAPYVEVNGTLLTAKDMDVTYKIIYKSAPEPVLRGRGADLSVCP
jgi:hypothetical protein